VIGRAIYSRRCQGFENGGQLFMVANEHLAYQRMLQGLFSTVETVAKQRGYAIYRGKRLIQLIVSLVRATPSVWRS
jgi:16S rRNA G1207 methylase RsmC